MWLLVAIVVTLCQFPLHIAALSPGELQLEPSFLELYHPQKQFVQLTGVCQAVNRISLASIFSKKMNFTDMSSTKAQIRGLFLSTKGSSQDFVAKLMESLSQEGLDDDVKPESVLSFDKKKSKFSCTKPEIAQCNVLSATPFNESSSYDDKNYGLMKFSARFYIGASDASTFMCSANEGKRKPVMLFVNTLPTLSELIATIDHHSKEVTVRCSGIMSAIFSPIYTWELLIVSPNGNSHVLDEWSKVAYDADKPEPGLVSATLTAVLPVSRIPITTVTFHCQVMNILGKKYTQRLLPFVLDSVMELPTNIEIKTEKLSPMEVLGTLPKNIRQPMPPLSTFYRLRCSFESVAPQLVRIVWDSYFFNPMEAKYIGKRHGLDHQYILLNETLYSRGHHLCRVWLKDTDPSTSLCSEPVPETQRHVPLCKNITVGTNESSLIGTDLAAFVPITEPVNAEPSRDLLVQSMTTALIVLSIVSGVFFLCLIMMIGRFHCRFRPLVRDSKHVSSKSQAPVATAQRQPSIVRRNSFPHAKTDEHTTPEAVPFVEPEPAKLFSPPRPAGLFGSAVGGGLNMSMHSRMSQQTSSVACEADFGEEEEDDWGPSLSASTASAYNSQQSKRDLKADLAKGVNEITASQIAETPAPIESDLSKEIPSSLQ